MFLREFNELFRVLDKHHAYLKNHQPVILNNFQQDSKSESHIRKVI